MRTARASAHATGSLYPPLALHALVNCVGVAARLGWTWQAPVAIVLSLVATCAVAGLVAGRLADPVPAKFSGPEPFRRPR